MDLSQNYRWEAELPDGRLMVEGADVSEAVRFSFVPQVPGLPRHDVVGVKLVRRFSRGFIQALGGGLREYLHCLVCEHQRIYVRSDGVVLVTPPDFELYL